MSLAGLEHYTIGFAILSKDENGNLLTQPAGSGTLVRIEQRYGIVTAGHVIENLMSAQAKLVAKNQTDAGVFIVRFREQSTENPIKMIPLDISRDMVISLYKGNKQPPDLAFLLLSDQQKGWMEAQGVFYNFDLRMLQDHNDLPILDEHVVVGFVEEKVELVANSPTKTRQTYVMDIVYGSVIDNCSSGENDYFSFRIRHDEIVTRPSTYGGLSGAAIWATSDGAQTIERLIVGVAFQESEVEPDGSRKLFCHGIKSLYVSLFNAVSKPPINPNCKID